MTDVQRQQDLADELRGAMDVVAGVATQLKNIGWNVEVKLVFDYDRLQYQRNVHIHQVITL